MALVKKIFSGSLWVFLTMSFGLMQIWFLIGSSYIVKDYQFNHDLFLLDGGLVFFSSALVSSITIDYHLYSKNSYNKIIDAFMFYFFPMLIIITSVWLFSIIFQKNISDVEIEVIKGLEYSIVTSSLIYSFACKIIEMDD